MPAYDAELFDPPAPLARVTLRHSETRATQPDVPMLIDSGSDTTLIPQSSANLLGAAADSDKAFELMGFDGNMSMTQAVRLELVFLGRAFKGQFLLIDQKWGILGRNILNHLAVILDGPQLTWSEKPSGTA